MNTPAIPSLPQNPDIAAAYQQAFDALGTAYWDASDPTSKALIRGTKDAIGDIITVLDEQDLATNTAAFLALTPKMKAINDQLKQIEASINQITKNIDTVSSVLAAANKVLSLLPL